MWTKRLFQSPHFSVKHNHKFSSRFSNEYLRSSMLASLKLKKWTLINHIKLSACLGEFNIPQLLFGLRKQQEFV